MLPRAPFCAAAVFFLAVTGAALALRTPLGPDRCGRARASPAQGRGLAGLRYVRASPYLRYMLVWFALVNGAFAGLGLLLVVLCRGRGASPGEIGTAQAVGSAGAVLGALACEHLTEWLTGARLLTASSGLLVAGAVAMAVPGPAPLTGIAYAGALFLTPAVNVAFQHHLVRTIPDEPTGRISSARMTAARSLNWFFLMGAGALADRRGPLLPLLALAGRFLALACANHVLPAGVRRAVIRTQLLRADLDAPRKQRHTVTWTFHRLAQAPSSFRESAALPRRIYGPELTTSQSISC